MHFPQTWQDSTYHSLWWNNWSNACISENGRKSKSAKYATLPNCDNVTTMWGSYLILWYLLFVKMPVKRHFNRDRCWSPVQHSQMVYIVAITLKHYNIQLRGPLRSHSEYSTLLIWKHCKLIFIDFYVYIYIYI